MDSEELKMPNVQIKLNDRRDYRITQRSRENENYCCWNGVLKIRCGEEND